MVSLKHFLHISLLLSVWTSGLRLVPYPHLLQHFEGSLVPDPPWKAERGSGVLKDFCWGGVRRHKECSYSIPPMHCMQHVRWNQVYDCSASVQQHRSLDPASASTKTVVEHLATVSPELELANGSVQGMLYKTGEGCDLPCYSWEHNK